MTTGTLRTFSHLIFLVAISILLLSHFTDEKTRAHKNLFLNLCAYMYTCMGKEKIGETAEWETPELGD